MLLAFGAVGIGLHAGLLHIGERAEPTRESLEQAIINPSQVDQERHIQRLKEELGRMNNELEQLKAQGRQQQNAQDERKDEWNRVLQAAGTVLPGAGERLVAVAAWLATKDDERRQIDDLKPKKRKACTDDKPNNRPVTSTPENSATTLERIRQFKGKANGNFSPQEVDGQLRNWYAEAYRQLDELEVTQRAFSPQLVRDYFILPVGGVTAEKKEPLPPEIRKAVQDSKDDNRKWYLRLLGLHTRLGAQRELREVPHPDSLDIQIVERDEKGQERNQRTLAHFSLQRENKADAPPGGAPRLGFWWKSAEKTDLEARRLIRNSVLRISKDDGVEEFFLGLARINDDPRKLPWEFDLSKNPVPSVTLARSTEDSIERGLFLGAVCCEMDYQMRWLRALCGGDTAELRWDGKVVVHLKKKDDEPGKYQLTAEWIGEGKPPRFYVHSFVAYTKIDRKAVEVWRLDKK
jgi:hypothetical protein